MEMCGEMCLDLFPVIRVYTPKPLIGLDPDFILPVPKHLLPTF